MDLSMTQCFNELEVVKMLQVYVIEAVKIPLSGSVGRLRLRGADEARYLDYPSTRTIEAQDRSTRGDR
jgi:hypothetical protein